MGEGRVVLMTKSSMEGWEGVWTKRPEPLPLLVFDGVLGA